MVIQDPKSLCHLGTGTEILALPIVLPFPVFPLHYSENIKGLASSPDKRQQTNEFKCLHH